MFRLGSVVHGLQQATEHFLSVAGDIVGDFLQHHEAKGETPTEDESLTKTNQQQTCLDTSQGTIDTESVEEIEDGLRLVSLEERGVDKVVVEAAPEQDPTQLPQDTPFAERIVDPMGVVSNASSLAMDTNNGVNVKNEKEVASALSKSTKNGFERELPLLNDTTNEKPTVSTIKTANTVSIPKASIYNTALAFAKDKHDTLESKHATSPTKISLQSKATTQTAKQPAVMTSNVSTVPMTIDLSNVNITTRGSSESSKSTVQLSTSLLKKTSTVPPRKKVTELSVDAKTVVKVPVTRKSTPTVTKPTLAVTKDNKTGPTRAGRKRNRRRQRNRRKRNQNVKLSVRDPLGREETWDFRVSTISVMRCILSLYMNQRNSRYRIL